MGLILLSGPALGPQVGTVLSVTNVQKAGSQGLVWAYEQSGGIMTNTRRYTNTLRVITNNAYVGPLAVQQFLIAHGMVQGSTYRFPLPEFGPGSSSTLPSVPTEIDTGSFLSRLSFEQETEDGRQWLCRFEYGPFDAQHEVGTTDAASGASNPLEMAPEAQWTPTFVETAYPQDINGLPFLNTVGDPVEDPPKREESRQSLSFVRNEDQYNEAYADTFRLKINADPFLGFAPGQARVKTISGKRVYTADYGYYWQVTYEFEFRKIIFQVPSSFDPETGVSNDDGITITYGWEDLVLNAGFRQVGSDGEIAPILIKGQPLTSPMALTESGEGLNLGVNIDSDIDEPYYLIFQQYGSVMFSDLNIPTNILTANQ